MQRPTVVDEVADKLAYRIAAGVYAPGDLMPSVRQVAAEFQISAPTANAILGRLAAAGFADARRGLGHTVRDVRLYGGIESWRYVFRFSRQLPGTATKIFEDIIEADQLVLFQTIRAIVENPRRYDSSPVRRAMDRLALLVSGDEPDVSEILRAELHVLRTVLASVGQVVFLGMFNSIGEMLVELPETAEAFYGPAGPHLHLMLWQELLKAWEQGLGPDDGDLLPYEALISDYHAQVVQRFRELIADVPAGSRPAAVVGAALDLQ